MALGDFHADGCVLEIMCVYTSLQPAALCGVPVSYSSRHKVKDEHVIKLGAILFSLLVQGKEGDSW